SSFVITADACTDATLLPGTSCTITMHCAPTSAARDYRAPLTVNWRDGFNDARRSGATLRCTGLAGAAHGRIAVDPPEAWLGATAPGTATPPTRFAVQSIGDAAVTVTSVKVNGAFRLEFPVVADTCTDQ